MTKDLFNYSSIAEEALNDLKSSSPKTLNDWKKTIQKSKAQAGDHWLIILPNSHPLVCFYPLMLAYASGLTISIKYPRLFNENSTFISFVVDFLNSYDNTFIQGTYQGHQQLRSPSLTGVICYSNNQTINIIEKQFYVQ